MIVLNNTNLDNATITALTEAESFKFSDALIDQRRSRYGRTTSITSQYIDIDFGEQTEVNYFGLVDDNLSSTATITVSANTVDDGANPVISYTIPFASRSFIELADVLDVDSTTFTLVDELDNYVVDENSNNITGYASFDEYRYWRISLSDVNSLDTYIQLSNIFLDTGTEFPYMSKTQKIPTASTATVTESPTGQVFGDEGIFYRYGTINFPIVENSDKKIIDTLFRAVDKFRPILVVVWEDDIDLESPIYSRFTTDLDWTRAEDSSGLKYSLAVGFKEQF